MDNRQALRFDVSSDSSFSRVKNFAKFKRNQQNFKKQAKQITAVKRRS